MEKKTRHSWSTVPGWFKKWQCSKCNAVKQWEKGWGKVMFYNSRGSGPFFATPKCESFSSTDVKLKT